MVNLGRDFQVPRKRNRKQWRKVELLFRNGIIFDSCGCSGPGWRPRTLLEAEQLVRGIIEAPGGFMSRKDIRRRKRVRPYLYG